MITIFLPLLMSKSLLNVFSVVYIKNVTLLNIKHLILCDNVS